jgi:outer membrane protein W
LKNNLLKISKNGIPGLPFSELVYYICRQLALKTKTNCMKKFFFVAILAFLVTFSNAQSTEYKPFRVDFGMGYAIPGGGKGAKAGLLFSLEPKFAVTDNITTGVRFEGAILGRATTNADVVQVSASGSYLLTGDYYFTTNAFRPFAGAGIGLYHTAAAVVDVNSNTDPNVFAEGNKFGGMLRGGFDYGHFRMALEYNMVSKTASYSNSYLGIKLNFFLGGGRND